MRSFSFHTPETILDAAQLLSYYGGEAKLLAGGTALITLMKQSLVQPAHLVSLHKVNDCAEISFDGEFLRIGALATHREVETSKVVSEQAPLLAYTYGQVATVRIRNVATVGGGLAHADPAQDPQPALLALGALVRLVSACGERLVLIDDFCVDYYETDLKVSELIAEVLIPIKPRFANGAYLKYLPRTQDDYATVSVAALGTVSNGVVENVRLALGSVGSVPIRAKSVESMLIGHAPTNELLATASSHIATLVDPLEDVRGSASYKREMAVVFSNRALSKVLGI